MNCTPSRPVAIAAAAILASACAGSPPAQPSDGPRVVQPGAPGQATQAFQGTALESIEGASHTEADVRFMQGMIHHHAQALQMAALIPTHTDDENFHRMGLRIQISQTDEIGMMRRWLLDRDLSAPSGDPSSHLMMMPGMLSAEQMQQLRDARGVEFERYFLQFMIQHHGGAIVMVQELFATPAAGQESTINFFASEVDSDQTIEIQRMQQMLAERR